jgi:foldase protein PrsA
MLAAALWLGACGAAHDSAAVRIGEVRIDEAAVSHWMSVMAGGQAKGLKTARSDSLRQQAIGFLISAAWLTREAAGMGLEPSNREIEGWLARRRSIDFPGGAPEYREYLSATGQSTADTMLEAKAELAAAKIRAAVVRRTPEVTATEAAEYYRTHRQQFAVPEWREVEVTNRKSDAAARQLKSRLERGDRVGSGIWRWHVDRPPNLFDRKTRERPAQLALERAMFSARPGVFVGPIPQYSDFYLVRVVRMKPGGERPLSGVLETIERQLNAERRQHALAAFANAWRARWTARTDCRAGFVVPKCRQHTPSSTTPQEDATLALR